MNEEEQVRRALRGLIKKFGDQTKICKKYKLQRGTFSKILSGELSPSDRVCRIVGWRKTRGLFHKKEV